MSDKILTNQLRYYKGHIVYYYYSDGNIIRLPIVKVDDEKSIDERSCLFKVKPLDKHNKEIIEKHDKISEIIKNANKSGVKVSRDYIKNMLKVKPKEETFLLDLFDSFIEIKEKSQLSSGTIKDFKSCKNVLSDFQDYKTKELTPSDINHELLLDFRTYLLEKRNYNNSSVQKRFKTLSSFLKSINIDYDSIKPTLSGSKTDYITLSKTDLLNLKNFKKFTPKEQVWIDLFLMNCFMGLRFGDYCSLDDGTFKEEDGELFYYKTNEKTKVQVKIFIVKTVKDILEKYNYKVPIKLNNQVFNKMIKKIFDDHDLFPELVKISKDVGGKTIVEERIRRKLISTHTMRRTFITNSLLSGSSLPNLMLQSGHTQISTVSKYSKKTMDIEQSKKLDI